MRVIKYDQLISSVDFSIPSIFFAGPTVRGNLPHLISWREEAVRLFEKFNGNLIIPEFPDKYESDQFRYDIPLWEFEGLKKSHVIVFWVPRTRELIALTTNHELGYWMARDREKVIYGRPNNAYSMTYLDIMWVEDYKERYNKNSGDGCKIYTSLESMVEVAMKKANK